MTETTEQYKIMDVEVLRNYIKVSINNGVSREQLTAYLSQVVGSTLKHELDAAFMPCVELNMDVVH